MGLKDYRKATAAVLFSADKDDRLTRWIDIGLIVLISLNVLAVILESVKELNEVWKPYFLAFEIFSVVVFSIEYLARVWSVVDDPWREEYKHSFFGRLKYMITPMALIDLLAIAPFFLGFFFQVDLRFLRALRLLRIFKLTRYSSAMNMLFQVFREEVRIICAAMFVLFLMVILASSMIFLLEHEAQPDKFASIPQAMYWALITMTTVGYGDVVPHTAGGQILGALLGILGVGMVALPAGILASGFSNALHRREIKMTEQVENALIDGVLSPEEEQELADLAQQLNLPEDAARAIIERVQVRLKGRTGPHICRHCGKKSEAPD